MPGVAAIPGAVLAAPTAAVAAKTYTLPAPTSSTNKALKARKSTWKDTFPSTFKADDVQQQEILNCYLAATLAALAHTTKGISAIKKMVEPKQGKIVTTCHDYDFDGTKGPVKKITSDRYYEVKFHNGRKLTVSDVLYMDDSDRNWNPRYMTSHSANALWPCLVEAAYASYKGSYEKIDASANILFSDFLKDIVGPNYELLDFKGGNKFARGKTRKLTTADVKAACRRANTIPVVGASRTGATSVTGWHGFAVLGLRGSNKVRLYDPLSVKEKDLDLKTLWRDFQALFVLNI